MSNDLDALYIDMKNQCLKMIEEKNVDIEELAFCLGITLDDFIAKFRVRDKDFSLYLKTYDLLLGW